VRVWKVSEKKKNYEIGEKKIIIASISKEEKEVVK